MKNKTRIYDCGTIAKSVEVRVTVLERGGKVLKEEVGNCDHAGECGVRDSNGNFDWAKCEHQMSPRS